MSPKLFSYIRNSAPAKACVIRIGDEVTSCPKTMAFELHRFLGGIQRWSSPDKRDRALELLEDK